MNATQKKAVGFLATGSLFVVAGITTLLTGGIPEWLAIAGQVAGTILSVFGIVLTAKPQ